MLRSDIKFSSLSNESIQFDSQGRNNRKVFDEILFLNKSLDMKIL